jgi:hypothetical protein
MVLPRTPRKLPTQSRVFTRRSPWVPCVQATDRRHAPISSSSSESGSPLACFCSLAKAAPIFLNSSVSPPLSGWWRSASWTQAEDGLGPHRWWTARDQETRWCPRRATSRARAPSSPHASAHLTVGSLQFVLARGDGHTQDECSFLDLHFLPRGRQAARQRGASSGHSKQRTAERVTPKHTRIKQSALLRQVLRCDSLSTVGPK